jgi:phosphoribosylaminoimidazole carboxylase
MGVSVKFLDPAEQAAAAVAAQQTVGHFRDAQAITAFATGCDVLTVEIEHINADAMEAAGQVSGVDVEPTPSTLRIIQVRGRAPLGSCCGAVGCSCRAIALCSVMCSLYP